MTDLTKEQRQEIEQIANRVAEEFHEIQTRHRKEVEAIFDQSAVEMKKHLSPAQQERFDEFWEKMKEQHRRWKRDRHRHPNEDSGPCLMC